MSNHPRVKVVSVIGAGSWGTSIAKVIAETNPGVSVKMWSYEKATASSINSRNMNDEYLPLIKLPVNISATTNLKDAVEDSDGIILAPPSKALPDIVARIGKKMQKKVPIAYLTKGFCRINNDILTISQTIAQILPEYKNRVVSIYGPSHAEEVTKKYHTCLNIASDSSLDGMFFYNLLNCEYLKCRISDDIIGVDVGGTLKNPAAIAAGMISILPNCGDNLSGALIAESLKEMIDLGVSIGARAETIIDISGTGDLVATALSEHSRNRRFGQDIARQIIDKGTSLKFADRLYLRFKPEFVLEKMSKNLHYLAEGAYAIEPLIELAERNNISIPVYRSLYEVLLNKKDPTLLIETIKDPEKFDEIYNDIKIHIKDKKKGLEGVKGKAFKRIIKQQIINKYTGKPDSEEQLQIKKSIILNLKNHLDANQGKGNAVFFKDEKDYLESLNDVNYEKIIRKLVSIYLNEIMDHYNPLFSELNLKFYNFKYYLNKIRGMRNEITTEGDFKVINDLKNSVNIVYITKYKNAMDNAYYLKEMRKNNLPVPRFFISNEILGNRLRVFFKRKSGGFMVNKNKFDNDIYRECIVHYISSLISHGVPVLYSPDIETHSGDINERMNESFFSLINEVLYRETTEIVLFPLQIKYSDRVNESLIRKLFIDHVNVKFSSPLFLSDFTKKSTNNVSLSKMIEDSWESDRIILPYHIVSRVVKDSGYSIKQSKLKKHVEQLIDRYHLSFEKTPRQIAGEGGKFLVKNKLMAKNNDDYIVIDKSKIDDYSSLIY